MQKLKQNTKPVGTGLVPAQNKGITLIALIITIIVMLILVGVTINVALNGGLFSKAEIATKETEEQAILEEMLSMMEITDDGKFNAQAIIEKMSKKYTVEGSIPNITITGKLGKYNYVVSEKEIKIGQEEDDLGEYYLKYLQGLLGIVEITDEEFEKYEQEVRALAEQQLVYQFGWESENNERTIYCSIEGYNYKLAKVNDWTVSLLDKNDDENQKVNSIVQESKSLEAELNELIIGTGHTYTHEDRGEPIVNYLKEKLSEGDRTVNGAYNGATISLDIVSSIQNNISLRYDIVATSENGLYIPERIENENAKLDF